MNYSEDRVNENTEPNNEVFELRKNIQRLELSKEELQKKNRALEQELKTETLLNKLFEGVRSCKGSTEITNILMKLAKSIYSFQSCSVYLLDDRINQFRLTASMEFSEDYKKLLQAQIEEGVIDWAIKSRKATIVENMFSQNTAQEAIHSLIICPLVTERCAIGTFVILSEKGVKDIDKTELELLSTLSDYVSIYIENLKLEEQKERKKKQIALLFETSKNINSVLELNTLLKTIMNETSRELGAQMGYLLLCEDNNLVLKASHTNIPYKKFQKKLAIGNGISGWVAQKGKPLLIMDYAHDPRFKNGKEFEGLRITSVISVPIISKGELIGVITLCNKKNDFPFTKEDLDITSNLAAQAGIGITNAKLFEELQMGYFDTISTLAAAIEAKDPYTRGHSQRVTTYCLAIANELGLSEEQKKIIQYSAVLHDIGKIGISEGIIGKPSPLTDKEYQTIKRHPEIGDEIVAPIKFLAEGRAIIKHHHERYDGKGYPDGLVGEENPLIARIAAVADSYDAMATTRPYDKAWTKEKAVARLVEVSNSQLDPHIVEVFVRLLKENKV